MKGVKLLLVVASFLITFSCLGQREFDGDSDWTFRDRSYFGLGLSGLNFGTNATYGKFFSIGVSGQLGYMLINNLSAGIGVEYQYDSYGDINVKNHTYGGYPFIRYNFKNFFIQTDYDLVTVKVNFAGGEAKQSFERFFVGLGYSSEAGSNAYLNILASYDLLYTNTSPFASPLSIRIYFTGWLD
jgi:hypothetical protein